jgi:hypothetical protein
LAQPVIFVHSLSGCSRFREVPWQGRIRLASAARRVLVFWYHQKQRETAVSFANPPPDKPVRYDQIPLPCPHCGRPTQSLKRYRVFDYLVFLFVAFSVQTVMHTACPRCMRTSLLLRSALNVVLANFLCPVVLLVHGMEFLATFSKGHSTSVLQILRG